MAEENDGAEKSFEASPQRLQQARKKGNVPQSMELLTFARYAGVMVALVGVGGAMATMAAQRMAGFLSNPAEASTYMMTGGTVLSVFSPVALAFLTFVAVAITLVIVALIAQQAITFAPTKLKPDLNKLNPVKNAGKKFGPEALLDFLKSLIKVCLFATVGILVLRAALPDMLASMGAPPALLAVEMRSLLSRVLFGALILSAFAAAIDVPLKWSQHRKKLRMSRQEMVDEAKEIDGNPEQKRARQEQARAIAQNRQLEDVPSADVVIVNPEHYAVALKWARDAGEVPRCVAKGVDHLALRIRQKAEDAEVPVYRNVATARSLYATVEVGEEIRREHYEAVAAAIRFADKLRKLEP